MAQYSIPRPSFNRAFTNALTPTSATPTEPRSPMSASGPSFARGLSALSTGSRGRTMVDGGSTPRGKSVDRTATMHVKRVTLTSKKNWWMVEMDEEEERQHSMNMIIDPSEQMPADPVYQNYRHGIDENERGQGRRLDEDDPPSPMAKNFQNPASIFSFPTPTAYSAPPNPTASLNPCARGSASELFKCVVKKPDVVQLEINGEIHSNATDVTTQFLAELRVYTTVSRHRNICIFLGSLENVGMVLEFIDGRTLYDAVSERPGIPGEKDGGKRRKMDYHNQLLDGLTHLHKYGLSHGDLSLLNVQVTQDRYGEETIKLLDFGRSVSADSIYHLAEEDMEEDEMGMDEFDLQHKRAQAMTPGPLSGRKKPKYEKIHPGTRPFCAPEISRQECIDPRLADAYSFGMILVCLDRCESVDVNPWDQRRDRLPEELFRGCSDIFGFNDKEMGRGRQYLKKWDEGRRRLNKGDWMELPPKS